MLNVVGSIVYSPGAQVLRDLSTVPTTFTYGGCFLTHSSAGLPSGVTVGNPLLDPNLTPGAASPALDVCDNIGGAPEVDFNSQARGFDQPTIPNLYGPNDLGAIERRTVTADPIFSNGFEVP